MKTRKFLVLFPAVFAMVAIFVSCNSVGIAKEVNTDTGQKIYTVKEIYITKDKGQVCVKQNPVTGCGRAVDCESDDPKEGFPIKELLEKFNIKFLYIEVPGAPCNSFIFDDGIPGNTRYYCSGGYCYPY